MEVLYFVFPTDSKNRTKYCYMFVGDKQEETEKSENEDQTTPAIQGKWLSKYSHVS